MVAYNFQSQFAPKVAALEKLQTIRPRFNKNGKERRHARAGENVQLYQGMRSRECRKLVTPDPVCLGAWPITIDAFETHPGGMTLAAFPCADAQFAAYSGFKIDEGFARADGFRSVEAMLDWFDKTHGFPFEAMLIMWHPTGLFRARGGGLVAWRGFYESPLDALDDSVKILTSPGGRSLPSQYFEWIEDPAEAAELVAAGKVIA